MSGAGSVDAIKGAGAGYEFPTEEVSWLKRDVLLFANSIGCTADELHFLYVCSNLFPQTHRQLTAYCAGTAPKLCCLSYLLYHPA
jgi:hypothetical protein